ncbi:hypothetical protein RAC89_00380 [Paenibacillus sp. GD4]|uniref:hypothetical protein n=1 Tax=Paenibacillus sp. GD4 TaxID=3068890 RepID=UPI002796D37E|nr:hypothetical protein [Paenibacillus sp. GD4]MDQ1908954.1 hypothetical protein [Paenibacillus sp. GD4]
MIELQHQLEKALNEIEALKQENQLLKLQLSKYEPQEEKSEIYENKIAETTNVVEVTPKPSMIRPWRLLLIGIHINPRLALTYYN